MRSLTSLDAVQVPAPTADEIYSAKALDRTYAFTGLKALLAAADFPKAGDRNAGIAASSEAMREAARTALSRLTVGHLYERPLRTLGGKVDSVMHVNYDVDTAVLREISASTLSDLKDRLMMASGSEILRLGRGLTGVMAAALAKLCDVHELIFIAKKVVTPTKARTVLGARGTLSSRLQPNHPTDDPRGIAYLCYVGLSLGAGDALIGVNPAVDTVASVSAVLAQLDALRRRVGAPTQICVLGHVKTQLAALERGAPVEILFQSLAGTESTNVAEFDITVDLLDRAHRMMAERGPLRDSATHSLYFETGQGSEFSYGRHEGIDMTTLEGLCYGLARRYDPFMVNNVTGFIGPETHKDGLEMVVGNLQDHFMGKLLGLPMGMAPCYTLHSEIGLESQQIAAELLTAAGANYFMDVSLNTDRMLAYFDTSAHDVQTLREVHGRAPAAEFRDWAVARGIFTIDAHGSVERGPKYGDVRALVGDDAEFDELRRATPAPHGLENAGPRPTDRVARQVRLDQSLGREAIREPLDPSGLASLGDLQILTTAASTKEQFLSFPELGSRLAPESAATLKAGDADVVLLIADGLSAPAVHHNVPAVARVLMDGLAAHGMKVGAPMLARHGRVKLAEEVAERTQARLVVCLLGERPGGDALASLSLSAYLMYRLEDAATERAARAFSGNAAMRFECTVVSNIYQGGLPPLEAGAVVTEKALAILRRKAAGNRLMALEAGALPTDHFGTR